MSTRHSTKKTSRKAVSQSNGKEPSVWLMMAMKVTPSMKLPTVFQNGNVQKTRPVSFRSVSASPSGSIKHPSVSQKSSTQINYVSKSAKGSAARNRPSSKNSSASRKFTTNNRSRSVAKTDASLRSPTRISSAATRKGDTAVHKSGSKTKQVVAMRQPLSSAKSDPIPKNHRGQPLEVRDIKSTSKRNVVSKQRDGLAHRHHHHHHHHHHPHDVFAPPAPVIVMQQPLFVAASLVTARPRAACRYCCCDIQNVHMFNARRKCCDECSTRHRY